MGAMNKVAMFCVGMLVGIALGFGVSYVVGQRESRELSEIREIVEDTRRELSAIREQGCGDSATENHPDGGTEGTGNATQTNGTDGAPEMVTDETPSEPTGGQGQADAVPTEAQSSPTEGNDGGLFVTEWPEGEMNERGVPKPNFGDAHPSYVSIDDTLVQIMYDGIDASEASDYIDKLKAAGFATDVNENRGSASYTYSAHKGDIYSAGILISYDNKGSFSMTYTAPLH